MTKGPSFGTVRGVLTCLLTLRPRLLHIHSFLLETVKLTLGLLFLKFSWFLGYIVLNLFLFSPNFFFLIFHKTVKIYNTKIRINDTTESQKEKKTCFNAQAGGKLTVQYIVNKQIWKVYILGIGSSH